MNIAVVGEYSRLIETEQLQIPDRFSYSVHRFSYSAHKFSYSARMYSCANNLRCTYCMAKGTRVLDLFLGGFAGTCAVPECIGTCTSGAY